MTFSGLLSKSLKHHTANNAAAAAAQAAKSGVVSNATPTIASATSSVSTESSHQVHNQIQDTLVSPKTDSASQIELAITSSPPQSNPIEPIASSAVEPLSSPLSQHHSQKKSRLLSSPQPKVAIATDLDMKPPTPLTPPSTTPSSPKAAGVIATKKKSSQQQLTPVQSASYRKRLNVNQVCDWCRYRKIRCDRESPCNSCQHSKRECIRTPPEVLLSKLNKESPEESLEPATTVIKAAKRGISAEDQDSQSSLPKAKKVARNNTNTHNNMIPSPSALESLALSVGGGQQSSMTMLSSGFHGASSLQDQEHLDRMRRIEMLLSNVIPGAAEFIAHGHQRSSSFSAAPIDLIEKQQQQQHILSPISPALTSEGSPLGPRPIQDECDASSLTPIFQADGAGLGDGQRRPSIFAGQEYIERMKRIEILLGSVQDNSINTAVAKLSSVDIASSVGINAKKPNTDKVKKEPKKGGTKKVARNSDGTIVKRPHVAAGFAGQRPPPKLPQAIAEAALKKLAGKKKKRATNNNNTNSSTATAAIAPILSATPACTVPAISTPITTTVVTPASPISTTGTTSPVLTGSAHISSPQGTEVQVKPESPMAMMLSNPKSFGIPSSIDEHHSIQENSLSPIAQQQQDRTQDLARQQQARSERLNIIQSQAPASYLPHHRHQKTPASYVSTSSSPALASFIGSLHHPQGGSMTNIGSIAIPTITLSNAMTSYESLVVPACNSAESSPASSPRITASTIDHPMSSSMSMSNAAVMPMDFLALGAASSTTMSSFPSSAGNPNFAMAMHMLHPSSLTGATDQNGLVQLNSPIDGSHQTLLSFGSGAPIYTHRQPHPLSQQHNHHALHIPQDTIQDASMVTSSRADFTAGLQMTDSLESWMCNQLVVPPLPLDGGFIPTSDVSSAMPIHHPLAMDTSSLSSNPTFLGGYGHPQQQPPQSQSQLQPQQHRLSLHQQSFYIPQMHDDDEEVAEEETHA
ncbi:hypothetical protein FBU30_006376 [Linnemannia zychae]|nr:hypothetical protein FBU30_006376 [Linnemannia zychae]